jgi:hypothetical protein
MVRVPRSYLRAGFAGLSGSGRHAEPWVRRIPVPPDHLFQRRVTVDLGNDGMAPTVTFSGAGAAQAFAGPSSGGDVWSLDQCFLSTSTGLLDAAVCTVFAGPLPLPQYAVTGSLAGGGSQFGMGGVAVPFGWFVWAVWSGGVAGEFGFLRVTGTKSVLTT